MGRSVRYVLAVAFCFTLFGCATTSNQSVVQHAIASQELADMLANLHGMARSAQDDRSSDRRRRAGRCGRTPDA